ncbi:MAG: helix-turn-helix domain-containing protein [Bdellovibrionales bacterium]|nr:helix-turn-helix domain-containing protein [Bdellovibrionales bacterium]
MVSKRLEGFPRRFQIDAEKQLRSIARKIQKKRERLQLSQEELAEQLNIGLSTLKTIEQSRRYPSLPMLFYICRFLEIKITIG